MIRDIAEGEEVGEVGCTRLPKGTALGFSKVKRVLMEGVMITENGEKIISAW